jgi:hypothetical protein
MVRKPYKDRCTWKRRREASLKWPWGSPFSLRGRAKRLGIRQFHQEDSGVPSLPKGRIGRLRKEPIGTSCNKKANPLINPNTRETSKDGRC